MDRYALWYDVIDETIEHELAPYGSWVKYSDVESLQARVRELEESIKNAYDHMDCHDFLQAFAILTQAKLKGPHDER